MTYEQALRKAAACLKLAADKRGSVEEAALAAAKAQEIMDRYNISSAAIDAAGGEREDNTISIPGTMATECAAKNIRWMNYLVTIVAKSNGCTNFRRKTNTGGMQYFLVGRVRDIQTTTYLLGMLEREVYGLSRDFSQGKTDGWRRDFRVGVVDAIRMKLDENKRRTHEEIKKEAIENCANEAALMRIDNAIAKIESREAAAVAHMNASLKLKTGRAHASPDETARAIGFAKGQKIKINAAVGAIGGNNARLAGVA